MTVITGVDVRAGLSGSKGLTPDLGAGQATFGSRRLGGSPAAATLSIGGPIYVVSWSTVGQAAPMFGGLELFEKILVQPRKISLGMVLAGSTRSVEVWNTHQAQERPLTGLSAGAELIVTGPSSLVYGPGQSQVYTVSIPAAGAPVLNVQVTWAFTGETGATCLVTGTRLLVFSSPCDWSQPYEETPTWWTSILSGHNGAEQRRRLRPSPRFGVSYRVLSLDEAGTMVLEGLLFGWQDRSFGVPVWPQYAPLLAGVDAGATSLPIDTTSGDAWRAGGFGMVWTSQHAFEAFRVLSVVAGTLTIDTPLSRSWPVGARVVPLRVGTLPANQQVARPTNWLTDGTVSFECEAAV